MFLDFNLVNFINIFNLLFIIKQFKFGSININFTLLKIE